LLRKVLSRIPVHAGVLVLSVVSVAGAPAVAHADSKSSGKHSTSPAHSAPSSFKSRTHFPGKGKYSASLNPWVTRRAPATDDTTIARDQLGSPVVDDMQAKHYQPKHPMDVAREVMRTPGRQVILAVPVKATLGDANGVRYEYRKYQHQPTSQSYWSRRDFKGGILDTKMRPKKEFTNQSGILKPEQLEADPADLGVHVTKRALYWHTMGRVVGTEGAGWNPNGHEDTWPLAGVQVVQPTPARQ
jgi:hypothetical protein